MNKDKKTAILLISLILILSFPIRSEAEAARKPYEDQDVSGSKSEIEVVYPVFERVEQEVEEDVPYEDTSVDVIEEYKEYYIYETVSVFGDYSYDQSYEDILEEEEADTMELLALTVQAECGGEDIDGVRLVVDVILNRLDDERFPNDILSVISEPHQFAGYRVASKGYVKEASDKVYQAIEMEMGAENRLDSEILYFNNKPIGRNYYKHGGHFFGK